MNLDKKIATRQSYGEALKQLGKENENIVVLDADLSSATKTNLFAKEFKDIYPKRKESIERVFADCKEQHNLRFTRVKGLKRNQHQVLMIFACHNLKKMANWSWDINQSMAKAKSNLLKFYIKIQNLTKMKIKRKWYSYLNTTLSTI